MKTKLFIALALITWTFSFAQEDTDVYKLTANDVEHFIKEYPALKGDLEKYGAEYDESTGEFTLPETVKAMSDFNHIIVKHGYKDYEDFIVKVSSLMMAYASIVSKEGIAESEVEIKEKIKEIDANPNLTYDQKEMMKNQLQAGLTMMASYSAIYSNSANIAVVNQYVDKLKVLFDE